MCFDVQTAVSVLSVPGELQLFVWTFLCKVFPMQSRFAILLVALPSF